MIKHIQNLLFGADAHLWPTMAIWQTATPEKLAAELDSIEMTSNEDIEQRRDRIQKQLSELRNELNTSAEASRLAKLETEITQQTEALKQAVADHQEREKALITSASRVDVPPGGKKAYIGTRRGSLNVRILNSDGDTVNTTPDGARWKLPKNTEVIDLGERKPGDANSRYKGEWAKISFKEPGKDTPIHAWVAADYLVDHPSKAASRKEAVRSTPSAAAAKEAEKKAEVAVKTAQDKVTKLEGDRAAMKEEDDPDAYQAKKDEVEAAKAQLAKAQEAKEKVKAAPAAGAERGREVAFEGVPEEEKDSKEYMQIQALATRIDPKLIQKAYTKIDEGKGTINFHLDLKLPNGKMIGVYTSDSAQDANREFYWDGVGGFNIGEKDAKGKWVDGGMYEQFFAYDRVGEAARFIRNAGKFDTATWAKEGAKEEVPTAYALMNELTAKVLSYTPNAKMLVEKGTDWKKETAWDAAGKPTAWGDTVEGGTFYNLVFEKAGRLFIASMESTNERDSSSGNYQFWLSEYKPTDDSKIMGADGKIDFSKITGTGQLEELEKTTSSLIYDVIGDSLTFEVEMAEVEINEDGDKKKVANFGDFERKILKAKFAAVGPGVEAADRATEGFKSLSVYESKLMANRAIKGVKYEKDGEKTILKYEKNGRFFKLVPQAMDKPEIDQVEVNAQGAKVEKGLNETNLVSAYNFKSFTDMKLNSDIKDEGLEPNDFSETNFSDIYETIPRTYLSKLKGVSNMRVMAADGTAWERTKADGTKETVQNRYYHVYFTVNGTEWSIFADNATAGTFYYEKKVGGKWESPKSDGILSPRPGEASAINSLADVKWAETFGAEAATAAAPAAAAEAAKEVTIDAAVKAKIKAERDSLIAPSANPTFTAVGDVKIDGAQTKIDVTYDKEKVTGQVGQLAINDDPFGLQSNAVPDDAKLKEAILNVLNEK